MRGKSQQQYRSEFEISDKQSKGEHKGGVLIASLVDSTLLFDNQAKKSLSKTLKTLKVKNEWEEEQFLNISMSAKDIILVWVEIYPGPKRLVTTTLKGTQQTMRPLLCIHLLSNMVLVIYPFLWSYKFLRFFYGHSKYIIINYFFWGFFFPLVVIS